MDIWYTPERIDLQREIAQRRADRFKRREARAIREERMGKMVCAIEVAFGSFVALLGFWAVCLWAFL